MEIRTRDCNWWNWQEDCGNAVTIKFSTEDISAERLMDGLMSVESPLAGMTADQAIANDAKSYTEGGRKFVLAQIEESQMAIFHRRVPELSAALDKAVSAGGLDFMALMVTDPVRGNSELMFAGDEAVRRALPYRKGKDGVLLMPGVLSRKKQLLPEIIAALA